MQISFKLWGEIQENQIMLSKIGKNNKTKKDNGLPDITETNCNIWAGKALSSKLQAYPRIMCCRTSENTNKNLIIK